MIATLLPLKTHLARCPGAQSHVSDEASITITAQQRNHLQNCLPRRAIGRDSPRSPTRRRGATALPTAVQAAICANISARANRWTRSRRTLNRRTPLPTPPFPKALRQPSDTVQTRESHRLTPKLKPPIIPFQPLTVAWYGHFSGPAQICVAHSPTLIVFAMSFELKKSHPRLADGPELSGPKWRGAPPNGIELV